MGMLLAVVMSLLILTSCQPSPPVPTPPDPERELIAKGRELFFNETFNGNGRTCGTCHPAENNFTLEPAFIATLPPDNPLFVAEFNPALKENFENPTLMRMFGLILENLDGFADLPNTFTMRGIPHTLGLRVSVDSRQGPRTGWSGDGAPGDGSLRSFATGAVIQHFTRTMNRVPGEDFRLPTDAELDALEAFQLSLGRQEELVLPLPLKGLVAARGQAIFNDQNLGKCAACHFNAGANANPALFGPGAGNLNFDTGVEALPDQPARLTDQLVPPDDGFGVPGDGTFNTPSLVEAADTGPFFHNNAVETIEGAVAFYNGDAFNNSPAGQAIAAATGSGINLDATQVVAVAAFLRVVNTLENIRQSIALLEQTTWKQTSKEMVGSLLKQAIHETDDAIMVLTGGGLHPAAVAHLKAARAFAVRAIRHHGTQDKYIQQAIDEHRQARRDLIETP